MQIELFPLKDIIPYPFNAKKHPRYQVEQIKQSILEFGNNDPIAIDENNQIIEGHGRYLALKELGFQTIPIICLKHLSDEQKKAYILAHNKITLNTDFDLEILKKELTSIVEYDMSQFGFSINLLSSPIIEIEEEFEDQIDDNHCDIQVGDIYQLGKHRLMCGDSTNSNHLSQLIDGVEIDLYLTDPPYNVSYEGKTKESLTIKNDCMSSGDFQYFLSSAFRAVNHHLKKGAVFYIWHADKERQAFSKAIESAGWLEKQCLIWVKDSFVLGRQDYQWQHEPCLYGWKKGASHYFVSDFSLSTILESDLEQKSKAELLSLVKMYQGKQATSILKVKRPSKNHAHPTMKPLTLIERLVRQSSRRGEYVLDTFAGSGSTLLVCEKLGRINYSMDIDPKYINRILKRFKEETGIQGEKIN